MCMRATIFPVITSMMMQAFLPGLLRSSVMTAGIVEPPTLGGFFLKKLFPSCGVQMYTLCALAVTLLNTAAHPASRPCGMVMAAQRERVGPTSSNLPKTFRKLINGSVANDIEQE